MKRLKHFAVPGAPERMVACALALALLLAASEATRPPPLCQTGSIQYRLRASIPPQRQDTTLDAAGLWAGFGTAALNDWRSLGDGLLAGGRLWLRPTDSEAPDYLGLRSGRRFYASSFTYLTADTGAPWRSTWPQARPLTRLWSTLSFRYPTGAVVTGYMHFARLETIAIARAPAYGLSIPANVPYYYTTPLEASDDAWAYVVGVVRPAEGVGGYGTRYWIDRIMPRWRDGDALAYVHALSLLHAPRTSRLPPTPVNAAAIGQLVDGSLVRSAELWITPLSRIAECP